MALRSRLLGPAGRAMMMVYCFKLQLGLSQKNTSNDYPASEINLKSDDNLHFVGGTRTYRSNSDDGNSFRVHPFPGGDTLASPWYSVSVGDRPDQQGSFVWFTSNLNRQPVAKGNNVPALSNKDTSFAVFDLSGPTLITVSILNASGVEHATVLPSSAGIIVSTAPSKRSVSFTIDRPRQICLVINQNMARPLCIFADPFEENPPTHGSENLIYFGPGVHHIPGNVINVTENQSVYLAGGAHVYGQVRAVGVQWSGFWVGGEPCDNVRVFGRGVLDGHDIPIDYRAHAMIELPACSSIRVEGITTINSPQVGLKPRTPDVTPHCCAELSP